ncbi:MAG: hypothetical protein RIF32_00010 [Leptospirales bacterium]|jgi:hypothetical protein
MNNENEKFLLLEREARAALQFEDDAESRADQRDIERIRSTIERKPLVDGLLQSLFSIPLLFFVHLFGEIAGALSPRSRTNDQK